MAANKCVLISLLCVLYCFLSRPTGEKTTLKSDTEVTNNESKQKRRNTMTSQSHYEVRNIFKRLLKVSSHQWELGGKGVKLKARRAF